MDQPRQIDGRAWFGGPGRVLLALVWCCVELAGTACRQEPPLPVLGPAPRFALTDQDGLPFGSDDLGGRLALADFIYTTCVDSCPLLTANMAQVQERLRGEGLFGVKVMLLSFSVDPPRDSPAALKSYGERFGVDHNGWRMLTGDSEAIGQLGQDFKLGRPIPLPLDARSPVVNLAHSNRFILVDAGGQVRAYYSGDSLDPDEVVRDIHRLTK